MTYKAGYRLNITSKIFLGFGLVLSVFITVLFMSNRSVYQASSVFDIYNEITEETTLILNLDKKISDLQKYIIIYSHTGQNGAIQRARAINQELIAELLVVRRLLNSPDLLKVADKMSQILLEYPSNIDNLVSEREHTQHLIDNELSVIEEEFVASMSKIMTLARKNDAPKVVQLDDAVQRIFYQLQTKNLLFFRDKNRKDADLIKELFAKLKASSKDISNVTENRDILDEIDKLVSLAVHYEETFYRSVQASRGYLFLVNVVLAGEAAEFLSLSSSLKENTMQGLERSQEAAQDNIHHAQSLIAFISILAVLLGLIFTFFIGRSIANPIRRITSAVTSLAEGEDSTRIPCLERTDEIGEIARAADVFKAMNLKTKELLSETQHLATSLALRETALEEKTEALEKSNSDLDNFAYVASHDLKSPLRAIDNLSLWIEEDCESVLPQESKEHLQTLRQRVKRMENLLSDLLNYSRVGRVDVEILEVDVATLLQDTIDLIEYPEGTVFHIGDMPVLMTQSIPLQQVFMNLLTNAIKYTDKPKIEISISAHNSDGDYVMFKVKDNGPGIEPRYHKRIFQMFQTLQSRDVIESSGMGLAIIEKVIESLGGEITVESELGQGSTFSFTWPRTLS